MDLAVIADEEVEEVVVDRAGVTAVARRVAEGAVLAVGVVPAAMAVATVTIAPRTLADPLPIVRTLARALPRQAILVTAGTERAMTAVATTSTDGGDAGGKPSQGREAVDIRYVRSVVTG